MYIPMISYLGVFPLGNMFASLSKASLVARLLGLVVGIRGIESPLDGVGTKQEYSPRGTLG